MCDLLFIYDVIYNVSLIV